MQTKLLFNMVSIKFFTRSNNDKAKSHVLYCRVSLNNTICEFSLKEKINKKYWNQTDQTYTSDNKEQNLIIESIMDSVRFKLKKKAVYTDELITAKQLVESLTNKQTTTLKLIEICNQYLRACTDSSGTIKNHQIKINNLIKFSAKMETTYTPVQFTSLVANKFIDWFCIENRTKNITTANRNVLFYKMCCKWYRKRGNRITTDLFDFEGVKDKVELAVFLTQEELFRVQNTLFCSDFLSRIRDLFIFQCYTGLSYCDIWSEWSIKKESFGTVITGVRGKNGIAFWLPVENDIVIKLLEKYEYNLPRYENQVYNRMLKEIALICNIKKRITTHTARKTFATKMDADGWCRETVAKMLGHSSVKTTELYYLGESFARLENEFRQRKKAV